MFTQYIEYMIDSAQECCKLYIFIYYINNAFSVGTYTIIPKKIIPPFIGCDYCTCYSCKSFVPCLSCFANSCLISESASTPPRYAAFSYKIQQPFY